jgi:hypothetical protein
MIKNAALAATMLWWLDVSTLGGSISYQVTLNADACHEVNLGKFSVPDGLGPIMDHPNFGQCRMEVRSGGESELFLGVACDGWPGSWPFAPEKYAVDPQSSGPAPPGRRDYLAVGARAAAERKGWPSRSR